MKKPVIGYATMYGRNIGLCDDGFGTYKICKTKRGAKSAESPKKLPIYMVEIRIKERIK